MNLCKISVCKCNQQAHWSRMRPILPFCSCMRRGEGFPGGSDGKESTCNVEVLGLIPGLGRSPGGGHGNPFQYFFLENPRTEEPGGICSIESQSWTQLEQLSMRVCITLVSWMVYQILCSKGCLFQKNPTCDLCFKKEKIIIPIILVLTIFKWLGDDTT